MPPNALVAERFDDNVAKVQVLGMVPLALQQGWQAADVWALLLLLLLLHSCAIALPDRWDRVLNSDRSCTADLSEFCRESYQESDQETCNIAATHSSLTSQLSCL